MYMYRIVTDVPKVMMKTSEVSYIVNIQLWKLDYWFALCHRKCDQDGSTYCEWDFPVRFVATYWLAQNIWAHSGVVFVDLSYTLLLPPGPNEDATAPYLKALKDLFYYFTTLTLGNDGSPTTIASCQVGWVTQFTVVWNYDSHLIVLTDYQILSIK